MQYKINEPPTVLVASKNAGFQLLSSGLSVIRLTQAAFNSLSSISRLTKFSPPLKKGRIIVLRFILSGL